MDFSGETIRRLMRLSANLPMGETREWLRSVFVERRGGHAFAGSTNAQFAAIEYAGPSVGPDCFAVLHYNAFGADAERFVIEDTPALGWTTINGIGSMTAAIRDPEAVKTLQGWRNWFPRKVPGSPGRAMFLQVDGFAALLASSPSGCVTFPKVIDAVNPIIVRDVIASNWIGVFFAQPDNGQFVDGATLPEWV